LSTTPELTRSTLSRWAAAAGSGDPLDLLDGRRSNRGGAAVPVCPELWKRFCELYLTIQARPLTLCWQIVAAETDAHRADCPHGDACRWPGLQAIRKRVRAELPPNKSDYYRLGQREWDRKWGPRMRRDYDAWRSNQLWTGDFHEFDVFCRRSEHDWTIVRPLLSAFLDLRSRFCPAWHICESENQDTVLLAFRRGVESVGPPQQAVIDNGKPYRAYGVSGGRPCRKRKIEDERYVRSVFGALGVEVHFAIPYNPDSKPIERWFRTVEEDFGICYASYCGGDLRSERFKAASKLAKEHPEKCPTVAELAAAFGQWLETYHARPHSGDGMGGLSPRCAFEKFDPVPKVILPDGLLDLLLMRVTQPVKVTRYGVRYRGIEYGANDPRLFGLQGQEILLRIHPEDAGYVVVCDLEGRPICRATNNQLALTGAGQEHVAEGMRARKRAHKLARQVFEGGTRAARQTVTEAAISAKLKASQAAESAMRKLMATGTDGAAPQRNLKPLKSDWAEPMEKFKMQVDPPVEVASPIADLDDLEFDDDDDDIVPLAPFGPANDDEPEMPEFDDEEWEDDDDP
jgi:transposase InsO family protein